MLSSFVTKFYCIMRVKQTENCRTPHNSTSENIEKNFFIELSNQIGRNNSNALAGCILLNIEHLQYDSPESW
jgi:hypothetical protein